MCPCGGWWGGSSWGTSLTHYLLQHVEVSCSSEVALVHDLGWGTRTSSFLVAFQRCLRVVAGFWVPHGELDLHPPMQPKERKP